MFRPIRSKCREELMRKKDIVVIDYWMFGKTINVFLRPVWRAVRAKILLTRIGSYNSHSERLLTCATSYTYDENSWFFSKQLNAF